jgi:hypothetical protein
MDALCTFQVHGKHYKVALEELVVKSQLPTFLGGTSSQPLSSNFGPWTNLIETYNADEAAPDLSIVSMFR